MANCSDPPGVARAYILSQNSTHVTYACFSGHGLSGYDTLYCDNGVWNTTYWPECLVAWIQSDDDLLLTNLTQIREYPGETQIPDWFIYGLIGVGGCFGLSVLAGLLLCWCHQSGFYDGPAVGFGGDYVYTDRRLCYFGDITLKCCNFICKCCKYRCCRYFRKQTHGRIHFEQNPSTELILDTKRKMMRKRRRHKWPAPLCLRAGWCLLNCLLCCCRKRKKKEEELTEVLVEESLHPIGKQEKDTPNAPEENTSSAAVPPDDFRAIKWTTNKDVEEAKVAAEKKQQNQEKPPIGPPLMAIKEAPKPGKKEVADKEKEEKEKTAAEEKAKKKKEESVGLPLMAIKEPSKPTKKDADDKQKEDEKQKEAEAVAEKEKKKKEEKIGLPLMSIKDPGKTAKKDTAEKKKEPDKVGEEEKKAKPQTKKEASAGKPLMAIKQPDAPSKKTIRDKQKEEQDKLKEAEMKKTKEQLLKGQRLLDIKDPPKPKPRKKNQAPKKILKGEFSIDFGNIPDKKEKTTPKKKSSKTDPADTELPSSGQKKAGVTKRNIVSLAL